MQVIDTTPPPAQTARYAKCIEVSKRVRWNIENDVIRGRSFDFSKRFLPEGLSRTSSLKFLLPAEQLLLSQIQGRTYANMFGLVERFIGIKMLELSRDYAFGDQVALEALVRFTDEELKHQELFRQIEQLIAVGMPDGYEFDFDPNVVAEGVLGVSTWAVLALTCHIELFTQVHYRTSLEADEGLSELYKDVFLFHWRDESQHAIIDELEWIKEDSKLTPAQRDQGVNDLIALVSAVDGIIGVQAEADAQYFARACKGTLSADEVGQVEQGLLKAYRWQYIVSGVQEPRFALALASKITPQQRQRIQDALAPIADSV